METSFNVLILGYGKMGHAMECLLRARHRLSIWDKFPPENFTPADLEQAAPRADVVLFCLPVNPHREVAGRIAPLIRPDCLCLSIAKGLDEDGRTAGQIFTEAFADRQPWGLIYGPMIAREIQDGLGAFAQAACSRAVCHEIVQGLFGGTRLFIRRSTDMTGINWSAILKNVYTLAFGIADELQLGDNTRGFLTVLAIREMEAIVAGMGGKRESVHSLAGLGDLVTTSSSDTSHHHHLGHLLAREEARDIEGEGVHTLAMVDKYRLFNREDYPLFNLLYQIRTSPRDAARRFEAFLEQQRA